MLAARSGAYRTATLRGAAGFSLVETAVTLAVLGVLAVLAVPSLRLVLPRVRLGNNASVLMNEIALARRRAIAQSSDYSIEFDTVEESYTLWKGAVGGVRLGKNVLVGSDLVSVTGFAPAGTATVVAFAGGAMNVPRSVGGAVNHGYLTLATPDGSRTKRIRVETLGRVAVER